MVFLTIKNHTIEPPLTATSLQRPPLCNGDGHQRRGLSVLAIYSQYSRYSSGFQSLTGSEYNGLPSRDGQRPQKRLTRNIR